MTSENIKIILQLSKKIDVVAADLYTKMSINSSVNEIREFWLKMAEEEESYIKFWDRAIEYSNQNIVPNIFLDEDALIIELNNSLKKAEYLLENIDYSKSIAHYFITAYWMEFYLLHSAFENIFHYMNLFCFEEHTQENYEKHVTTFLEAVKKYGDLTPELELLGSVLNSLWTQNKELVEQNTYDHLTKVLNRKGLFNAVLSFCSLAERNRLMVGVILVDVDNFKRINDTYGHQKGDVVLKEIANRMKENLRKSDLIGRYGGEEFLVFLNKIDEKHIRNVAEKLRESIAREPINEVEVTISLGCTVKKIQGKNIEAEMEKLIFEADSKLYLAKKNGKNRVEL